MDAKFDRVAYIAKLGQTEEIVRYLEGLFDIKFDDPVEVNGVPVFYSAAGIEIGTSPEGMEMEGFWGFVMRVPNMEVAKAELAAKGLQTIWEPVVGVMKEAVYNPAETKGVQFALCEYPESMPTANMAVR